MVQFRRRTRKWRLKYHLTVFYREKIEIKFNVSSIKVQFWNCEILKQKLHVSEAESAQESNGAISVYVGQIELPEILFLYMTSQFSVML